MDILNPFNNLQDDKRQYLKTLAENSHKKFINHVKSHRGNKIKIDDPVGAISVHGVAGIVGVMLVPFTKDVSFVTQFIGIVVIASWVFGSSFVIWFVIKKLFGIRISEQDEYDGADATECGVEAYPEFVGGKS